MFSEKDLKKLLAAYAQHSHSSAILFGTGPSSQGDNYSSTNSTGMVKSSSALTVKEQKPRRSTSGPVQSRGRRRGGVLHNAVSRALQRQSRLPNTPSLGYNTTSQGLCSHGSSAVDTDAANTATVVAERTDVTASPPPPYNYMRYSDELLESSSLPPSQKRSLCVLTRSLTNSQTLSAGRRDSDRLPPRGSGRGRRGQGVVRGEGGRDERCGRSLRRTLSSQSLLSVSSETSGTHSSSVFVHSSNYLLTLYLVEQLLASQLVDDSHYFLQLNL